MGSVGSIPGSGRSPRGGQDRHSSIAALENAMDQAWQAAARSVAELDTTEVGLCFVCPYSHISLEGEVDSSHFLRQFSSILKYCWSGLF